MNRKEYLAALKELGLSRAGQRTALVLGCSVRQLIRYARVDKKRAPIPEAVVLLLERYQKQPELMNLANGENTIALLGKVLRA